MTKARVNADNASADIQGVTVSNGLVGGGTSGTVDVGLPSVSGNSGKYLTTNGTTASWGNVASAPDFLAGKNKIINGDFNINQRAFSSATADQSYGFDRWIMQANGGATYSAQTFTPGTAPVAGYEGINFARLVTTGQSSTSTYTTLSQRIEDVRTFANQTATLSFWAKAASGTPKMALELQQVFGSGGSANTQTLGGQITLSTSWTRYSVTFTGGTIVPSVSGKTIGTGSYLELNLWVSAGSTHNTRTNSLGIQSNTFDVWGVQVEAGSVATPFTTATGTLQGELAACQRYYFKANTGVTFTQPWLGYFTTSSKFIFNVYFPVTMRATPTLVTTSGADYYYLYLSGGAQYFDSVGLDIASTVGAKIYNTDTLSGSSGQTWDVGTSNSASLVAFNSEL